MDWAQATREKRRAALASVATAVVLLALKAYLTLRTGSLGVLSEAMHSSLDLIGAILTYLTVRVSDKPADADHTYGHAKVENFSAFVQTALLLATAAYIIWEAIQRMFFQHPVIQPSLLAVGLLAFMVGLDVVRARALARVAFRFPSEALEADALHFSTDVWSTSVVLIGVAAVWFGQRFGWPGLRYMDPLAALGVAGFTIWVGARLGRRTLDALLDVAPPELNEKIIAAVNQTEGVLSAERVRLRRAGSRYFVDATISVPRTATLEQAHSTSQAVERTIARILPADVVVHVEPRARANENLFETIRAIAHRRGLEVHELSAHQFDGSLFIELHLEVDEHSTLRQAHLQATDFENEIVGATGGRTRVNIHIEPLGTEILGAQEMKDLERSIQDFLNSLQSEYHELVDCHEVRVRSVEHKILVSCHCAMDGALPITQVHDVTAALEDRLKEHFPQIYRLTIHPEPKEES
jgi:cation diffusion facilitator family transporter